MEKMQKTGEVCAVAQLVISWASVATIHLKSDWTVHKPFFWGET